jgi:hypothetical protein
MNPTLKTQLSSFGFLRLGLIGLSIVSILIPTVEWLVVQLIGEVAERSALGLSAQLIAPVMAPVLVIVILLDIIMAKVRAADDPTGAGVLYRAVSKVGTTLIIVMLLFWVPFFIVFI